MNALPPFWRLLTIGVLLAACSLGFGSSLQRIAPAHARRSWGFFASSLFAFSVRPQPDASNISVVMSTRMMCFLDLHPVLGGYANRTGPVFAVVSVPGVVILPRGGGRFARGID